LMFVGLAILSELIQKIINMKWLRDYLWQFVEKALKRFNVGV